MKKVLVIGGGIIGQFVAYYTSREGHNVNVIDDNPEMASASIGNCGLVTPSHVHPLNSFSSIVDGLKWMGKKDTPLSIKLQFNASFLKWLLDFIVHSKQSSIRRATEVRHQLLQLSWNLYETFFQEESSKSEWKKGGILYTCKTPKALKHLKDEVALHKSLNMESRTFTREEILDYEPLLQESTIGGSLFEMDGWLNPIRLSTDIKKINEKNSVRMIHDQIESFKHSNGKLLTANSQSNQYEADEIILCTGALSPVLGKKLGISIPVIPGKGYNLTTHKKIRENLKRPTYLFERKVVATPWENGFRLGSTMEFTGYDLSLNESRLEALKRAAVEYLRIDLDRIEFIPWSGWRPMKSNGIPIIERNKKFHNLVVATGHSMLGLSMAPATGLLVNELISEKETSIKSEFYAL